MSQNVDCDVIKIEHKFPPYSRVVTQRPATGGWMSTLHHNPMLEYPMAFKDDGPKAASTRCK